MVLYKTLQTIFLQLSCKCGSQMCSLMEAGCKLGCELDYHELSIFFCIMISEKVFIEQNVVSLLFLFEPFLYFDSCRFLLLLLLYFLCVLIWFWPFFSLTIFRHVRRKRTGVNCKMNRPYSHVSNHDQGGKDDVILLYSRLDTHTELFHHFVSDQQLKRQQRVKIWWSLVHISSYNSSLVRCQRTVNATTDHFMSLMSLFGSDAWYHRKGVNYSNLLAHIALN